MEYNLTPSEGRVQLSSRVALSIFLDTWTLSQVGADIGEALSCSEAEALCDLFAAHGHHGAADMLRESHIESDDEGDMNHNTGEVFTDAELHEIEDADL